MWQDADVQAEEREQRGLARRGAYVWEEAGTPEGSIRWREKDAMEWRHGGEGYFGEASSSRGGSGHREPLVVG